MKPNHHWVSHIYDQIHDYGPVYGFWTFTSERLNKVLKSFSTNNHDGGEIEMSFLRAFARNARLRHMVCSFIYSGIDKRTIEKFDSLNLQIHAITSTPSVDDNGLTKLAEMIEAEERDTRGTVASINSIVREFEELAKESKSTLYIIIMVVSFSLSFHRYFWFWTTMPWSGDQGIPGARCAISTSGLL